MNIHSPVATSIARGLELCQHIQGSFFQKSSKIIHYPVHVSFNLQLLMCWNLLVETPAALISAPLMASLNERPAADKEPTKIPIGLSLRGSIENHLPEETHRAASSPEPPQINC